MTRVAGWRRATGERPIVLGHRGVRAVPPDDPRGALPPENTLPAFERARLEGADGIELDVRCCATGEVVVMHDPDLARMTGGRDRRQVAQIAWPDLARIELGAFSGASGVTTPLLSEVLTWARRAGLRVNVELKHDDPAHLTLVREVAKSLARQPDPASWLIASSFHPRILGLLRVMFPHVPVAWLSHEGQRKNRPWHWARLFPFDAIHVEHSMSAPTLTACRDTRMVAAWTVNDPTLALSLAHAGVDVIITDCPGRVKAALS